MGDSPASDIGSSPVDAGNVATPAKQSHESGHRTKASAAGSSKNAAKSSSKAKKTNSTSTDATENANSKSYVNTTTDESPVAEDPIKPSLQSAPSSSVAQSYSDTTVALWILFASMFSRFYRLDQPPGVVFDEHHFGRFTNQYMAQTFFFDIHPPLGKLVFYYVGLAVGYDHNICKYTNIDDQYAPDCKYIWIRAVSAFFGALTAPIVYYITRNFGGSMYAGILAALLFILDGLNIGEARLILVDAQLIFWCAATLLVGQLWWNRWNTHVGVLEAYEPKLALTESGRIAESLTDKQSNAQKPEKDQRTQRLLKDSLQQVHANLRKAMKAEKGYMNWLERIVWVLLVGVCCGNSISVKYTGLGTPGMLAIESFFALFILKRSYPLLDLVGIAAVSLLVFAYYFYIHFALLPLTGDGDEFMLPEFKRTLIGRSDYDPYADKPPFFDTLIYSVVDMIRASDGITQRHHWESVWWEWIFNLRGILYYSVDKGHTYTETVYLLGNPLVIWLSFGAVVLSGLAMLFYIRYRQETSLSLTRYSRFFCATAFCACGYAVNLLPYLAVSRSCFIYHYMPALMYAQIMTGLIMDQIVPRRLLPHVTKMLIVVCLACFVYYSPWIYAFPLTTEGHARRRWLERWN